MRKDIFKISTSDSKFLKKNETIQKTHTKKKTKKHPELFLERVGSAQGTSESESIDLTCLEQVLAGVK